MTWYRQPGNDQDAHRGTLSRGRVVTHCGLAFAARAATRLDSGPSDDHGEVLPLSSGTFARPHLRRCTRCQVILVVASARQDE